MWDLMETAKEKIKIAEYLCKNKGMQQTCTNLMGIKLVPCFNAFSSQSLVEAVVIAQQFGPIVNANHKTPSTHIPT